MSLQDPSRKMSKSDQVDANIITLLDAPDVIARKVKRCVTDSGNEIALREDKPGVSNLLRILAAITDVRTASLEAQYRGRGYGQLKKDVADAIVALVEPIQARFSEIRLSPFELDQVLAAGAIRARAAAQRTLAQVHSAMGIIPR